MPDYQLSASLKILGLKYVPYILGLQHIVSKLNISQVRCKKHDHNISFSSFLLVITPFSFCTYYLRTDGKGFTVKVENYTKIANFENKKTSKTQILISPWLEIWRRKMSETRSLLKIDIK